MLYYVLDIGFNIDHASIIKVQQMQTDIGCHVIFMTAYLNLI